MNSLDPHPPRIFYEIFVRSFCDSNRDGKGDLNGITSKLDYLQDLGIEGIWLTPFFQSPSYHKYDVTNYMEVDQEYGNKDDFRRLLDEAHKRGLKVIIDFVINHTSSQHPWFLEAKKGKDNPYRNYYLWMTPAEIDSMGVAVREKTADSWETQPWHWANRGDKEKYYGMFWNGMPDLNMDNREVREQIYAVGKYWLEFGADGFRMDAAKHIYPSWEVEKSHDFWVEFRERMEAVKPGFYLVGEVWTSAEKVAPFFRGLKANFHFDLSLALQKIASTQTESENLVNMLLNNYDIFGRENPAFIDATMLTNHDQERLGSAVGNDKNKMKLAANLLLTLPGNPYIYYGEELGMLGKKPDENIREAFLWDTRANDKDRTNWKKPNFNTDSRVTPLRLQQQDPESVYNHYKKLISLRKDHPALWQVSPPNLQAAQTAQEGFVTFIRPHETGSLLVVQNLQSNTALVEIKDPVTETVFSTSGFKNIEGRVMEIPGFGMVVFRLG